jgi:Fe-S cluster assembly protein SufD
MTELAVVRTPAEEAIVERYPAFKAGQQHWGGAAVERLREQGFSALKTRGLPNRRVEEWKYTDLKALMPQLAERFDGLSQELVERAAALRPHLAVGDATRILFVNGRSVATLREQGFVYGSVAHGDDPRPQTAAIISRERDYSDNAAVALNSAFMDDWIFLRIPAGTKLDKPLHLEFREVGDKAFATYPRVLIVVEDGASANIIETHDGPDGVAYQTNGLIEFEIGNGARVEHVAMNAAGNKALALATVAARLGRDARFVTLAMTTGAAVSRQQLFLTFQGEGAQAQVRGATMLRGKQHCDSTLVINHAAPHCLSRETFKTVLDDEARGVFQGKIVVAPGAQKTDGKMAAHTLLLSEDAEANSKPELEIFADDVVCGHGATAGALDENLKFYLMARGIPEKDAEALLIESFVAEGVDIVEDEALREALMDVARGWLTARGQVK